MCGTQQQQQVTTLVQGLSRTIKVCRLGVTEGFEL